jgi:hypothetical protein
MSCESRDRTSVLIDAGTFFSQIKNKKKQKEKREKRKEKREKRKEKKDRKEKEKEKKSGSSITYVNPRKVFTSVLASKR